MECDGRLFAIEAVMVGCGPVMDVHDDAHDFAPPLCERILDQLHTPFEKIPALNEAVGFQFAEALGEHLLRDAGEAAEELAVAAGAVFQFTDEYHLPPAADEAQQFFHITLNSGFLHRGCMSTELTVPASRHFFVPNCADFVLRHYGSGVSQIKTIRFTIL